MRRVRLTYPQVFLRTRVLYPLAISSHLRGCYTVVEQGSKVLDHTFHLLIGLLGNLRALSAYS